MLVFEKLIQAYGKDVSKVFDAVSEALGDADIEDVQLATQNQLPGLIAKGYKVVGTFCPNRQKMH